MPYRTQSLGSRNVKETLTTPAEIAALAPEFALLSQITRNPLYHRKALKAVEALWDLRDSTDLLRRNIDIIRGQWADNQMTMTEDVAGYYRSVLNAYLINGEPRYRQIWQQGTTALKNHLLRQTPHGHYFRHTAAPNRPDSVWYYSETRLPGQFALAGDLATAAKLQKYVQHLQTSHPLLPQAWHIGKNQPLAHGYDQQGFEAENMLWLSVYAPESANWQAQARTYFDKLRTRTRTPDGYVALRHIGQGIAHDLTPTEFTARTLRCLYLIAKPSLWQAPYTILSGNAQMLKTHPRRK
jgi:hypothetical protein